MKVFLKGLCLIFVLMLFATSISAMKADQGGPAKKLDLRYYHNVGNIWLRVSNYGFFGSGDDANPQWPSLEYPGGSGVDYLYQGSLWFGAKKFRRNLENKKLYWKHNPPLNESDYCVENDEFYLSNPGLGAIVDTLVTVGFDGDDDLYEFLPAYNPLEYSTNGYSLYNSNDGVTIATTREQIRGMDDDGDGFVDEDPAGYAFPFRAGDELPEQFSPLGGSFLHLVSGSSELVDKFGNIWFPLGFVDLFRDPSNGKFDYAYKNDDDGDGASDEDGAPVSEQDFISYYYDYSPFDTKINRDYGNSASNNTHIPLNVKVRQMSYQWSYEYIKNLVYVEFDVTNMNRLDTLYDCSMGIYMDSDVGPQQYGATQRSGDDKSGYVSGAGYEFAYTFDADLDQGLTQGYVGSRVCTPDPNPDSLGYACWYWKVGNGPDDNSPLSLTPSPKKTANEKYWLLTGRNPDETKFTTLRKTDQPDFTQPDAVDTRYLFAFYGAQPADSSYTNIEKRWNLPPEKTMKIVIAIFPGMSIEELKNSAAWAKKIYGDPQKLTNVTKPDIVSHYNPPLPPTIPAMYSALTNVNDPTCGDENKGDDVTVFWDNRSEFFIDQITVSKEQYGWNSRPGLDSDSTGINWSTIPQEFWPTSSNRNPNAIVNPWTAYRLNHDFQGYTFWGRSSSGSQEDWEEIRRWDKVDTPQDRNDYNEGLPIFDFGGELWKDNGLPGQRNFIAGDDSYCMLDSLYQVRYITSSDKVYGEPIYSTVHYSDALWNSIKTKSENEWMLAFKPTNSYLPDDAYLALVDKKLLPIPMPGYGGNPGMQDPNIVNGQEKDSFYMRRMAARYYTATKMDVKKGYEYYVAVTAYDRGMPGNNLQSLETGRDANMKVFFPGSVANESMKDIYVVPNPYKGLSKFDGRREKDTNGDKSRRIWFVNLPEQCKVKIYTLAGDLVDEFEHTGSYNEDVISVSRAIYTGKTASGIHSWDLLSMHDQIIASGIYLFSVKNKKNGEIKVGKFAIIR